MTVGDLHLGAVLADRLPPVGRGAWAGSICCWSGSARFRNAGSPSDITTDAVWWQLDVVMYGEWTCLFIEMRMSRMVERRRVAWSHGCRSLATVTLSCFIVAVTVASVVRWVLVA